MVSECKCILSWRNNLGKYIKDLMELKRELDILYRYHPEMPGEFEINEITSFLDESGALLYEILDILDDKLSAKGA